MNLSNHKIEIESDKSIAETSNLIGYQIGFWMSNSISKKLDISSELSFSKEGFKYPSDSTDWKTIINYINLNTSINYSFSENISIGLGPEIGRNMYSKWVINKTKIDYGKYEKYAFGWNFNVQYKFQFPLIIGFRYYQGLNDINTDSIIVTDNNGNIINYIGIKEVKRNFQLNLYYRI